MCYIATVCNDDRDNMANLNIRIDANLKQEVDKILGRLGLNASDAVRIFFARIREERGIPFALKLPSKRYEDWVNQAIADAEKDIEEKRISGPFDTVDEVMKSLDAD